MSGQHTDHVFATTAAWCKKVSEKLCDSIIHTMYSIQSLLRYTHVVRKKFHQNNRKFPQYYLNSMLQK